MKQDQNLLTLDIDEELKPIPDAVMMPIDRVKRNPDQPRSEIEEALIERIKKSIMAAEGKRAGGSGIISPLLVRWEHGAFFSNGKLKKNASVIIVAGETRYHAAMRAGLKYVPVIVTDIGEDEAFEDGIIENVLRGDLSPEDEGRNFRYLMNKHGISALGVAKMIYHDPSRKGYVQSRVEMLRLNEIVAPMVGQRKDTITAARRIQTVKNEETQREMVEYMMKGGNFRELNDWIKTVKGLAGGAKEDSENRKALAKAFPPASDSNSPAPASTPGPGPEVKLPIVSTMRPVPPPSTPDSTSSPDGSTSPESAPEADEAPIDSNIDSTDIPLGVTLDSISEEMEKLLSSIETKGLAPDSREECAPQIDRMRKAYTDLNLALKKVS